MMAIAVWRKRLACGPASSFTRARDHLRQNGHDISSGPHMSNAPMLRHLILRRLRIFHQSPPPCVQISTGTITPRLVLHTAVPGIGKQEKGKPAWEIKKHTEEKYSHYCNITENHYTTNPTTQMMLNCKLTDWHSNIEQNSRTKFEFKVEQNIQLLNWPYLLPTAKLISQLSSLSCL